MLRGGCFVELEVRYHRISLLLTASILLNAQQILATEVANRSFVSCIFECREENHSFRFTKRKVSIWQYRPWNHSHAFRVGLRESKRRG
ncbi:hypothetical protein DFP72DRAFT_68553 [Ephemerocybe angulata]|uniref:Uncharacterized protein n=1 Tax=Ephemerocybe angulata TaxID=980116 RepID=A0A8H6HD14_9AGAR|nr:hypothetical protein DFP72DRAFT_68553 [Tulosesus angulatus]